MTEAVLDREQLSHFSIDRQQSNVFTQPIVAKEQVTLPGSALGRRANIALGSLEAGNSVLTIGSELLSSEQRQRLDRQGVSVIDESDIAEGFDGSERFDLIIGNLELDALDHTLPTLAEMSSNHADVYIDVYSPEPFANNDVLDDTLRQQDLYLRATRAESRKGSHYMQVDAIRNPRGEIAKGIRRGGPYAYRTGPSMETFYAFPGEDLK